MWEPELKPKPIALAYGKISGGEQQHAAHVLLITNYWQSTLNMHCQLPRANTTLRLYAQIH